MAATHETDVVKQIREEYQYGFSNPDEAPEDDAAATGNYEVVPAPAPPDDTEGHAQPGG